jgi:hypothetical protein
LGFPFFYLGSLDDNCRQKRQKQWWRTTQNGEEGIEFSMEQICNKIKKNGKIVVTSLPQWCFFSCIHCVQDIP